MLREAKSDAVLKAPGQGRRPTRLPAPHQCMFKLRAAQSLGPSGGCTLVGHTGLTLATPALPPSGSRTTSRQHSQAAGEGAGCTCRPGRATVRQPASSGLLRRASSAGCWLRCALGTSCRAAEDPMGSYSAASWPFRSRPCHSVQLLGSTMGVEEPGAPPGAEGRQAVHDCRAPREHTLKWEDGRCLTPRWEDGGDA